MHRSMTDPRAIEQREQLEAKKKRIDTKKKRYGI